MAPLKFRAWNTVERRMADPEAVLLVPKGPGGEQMMSGDSERWILMQSTGLEDKNGKEIFEGDIISYEYFAPEDDEPRHGIVSWDTDRWELPNRWDLRFPSVFFKYGIPWEKLEVAGNIWEHPELLKQWRPQIPPGVGT